MIAFLDRLAPLAWTQIWQVTVVAVAISVLTRLVCRSRPHLAYVLWLVVLIKCLTPPLWSSPTGVFSWAAQSEAPAAQKTAETAPVPSSLPNLARARLSGERRKSQMDDRLLLALAALLRGEPPSRADGK